MKQNTNVATSTKQTESFNVDLCIAVLGSTRALNERKLKPIVLK